MSAAQLPEGTCPFRPEEVAGARRGASVAPDDSARIAMPDASAPLIRRLAYGALCRVIHYPGLLRWLAAWLRLWPALGGGTVARVDAVKYLLSHQTRFSNASHAPNLVAGDFLIGMEPGPRYRQDKALFDQVLGGLTQAADSADREASRRATALLARQPASDFDLIEDYLFWVVWGAIKPLFGVSASVLASGSPVAPGNEPVDESMEKRHLLEARHVAAQLFAGTLAPLQVQRRAGLSADSLRARTGNAGRTIAREWRAFAGNASDERIQRNAVGLTWVSHPVTVQAGALIVRELIGREEVYNKLHARARALGKALWTDDPFRAEVQQHVRELMRFRPVFPILARTVQRNTEFDAGERRYRRCPAGASMQAWVIGAQFDPAATDEPDRFEPGRKWHGGDHVRDLMFGYGERRCPASEPAVEILTSAVLGLLSLPRLQWAGKRRRCIEYDGPMVAHLRLRFET